MIQNKKPRRVNVDEALHGRLVSDFSASPEVVACRIRQWTLGTILVKYQSKNPAIFGTHVHDLKAHVVQRGIDPIGRLHLLRALNTMKG